MSPLAKILVTDDEAVLVTLLRDCLEADGYDVRTATSGLEAADLLANHTFDLLVTDIRMPDINGIELLRRAKEIQPGIGALFMTGYANVESAKDAIKEGALDYLMKPFEISEIRGAIANALKKRATLSGVSATAELNRMSELAKIIYTVGDIDSLLKVSLGFALIHGEISYGGVLYWSETKSELRSVITINGDMTSATTKALSLKDNPLDELRLVPDFSRDYFEFNDPDTHFREACATQKDFRSFICPPWQNSVKRTLVFPIRRGDKMYGFLLMGANEEIAAVERRVKLMTVTAQQAALSIENLGLLEQTQRDYKTLQNLQERAIEVETMAARGEMAAEIGHELNNFLGVVSGSAALLDLKLGKGDIEGSRRHLQMVTENLEKMKRFTQGLMQKSSWGTTKTIVDATAMIGDIVDFQRPQKRFAGVDFRVDCPPIPTPFQCDPLQFQQLLYNIINNAADASRGKDTRWIEVRSSLDSAGKTFTISVADNGEGMTPEAQENAFNTRFTTKKDGHGYGLVVCRRIIDSHLGTLKIESTLHQGSTISISFPLAGSDI